MDTLEEDTTSASRKVFSPLGGAETGAEQRHSLQAAIPILPIVVLPEQSAIWHSPGVQQQEGKASVVGRVGLDKASARPGDPMLMLTRINVLTKIIIHRCNTEIVLTIQVLKREYTRASCRNETEILRVSVRNFSLRRFHRFMQQ
jgi:hypothetical protein